MKRGMSARHIERKIREKVGEWIESIDDEELRELLWQSTIVTGGAIVSFLMGEKPNDYDVYFRTLDVAKRVAEYYVAKFLEQELTAVGYRRSANVDDIKVVLESDPLLPEKQRVMVLVKSAGIAASGLDEKDSVEVIQDTEEQATATEGFVVAAVEAEREAGQEEALYVTTFLTSNAITLSDDVQLVLRFYGKPSEIHQTYDFEHCKSYWRSWAKAGDALTLLKSALQLILERRLHYTGSQYPLCSLFRLRKFQSRGWYYPLGEVLKIAFQVTDLDLSDPIVLEDQLVGMDIAYFLEIIRKIKEDGVERIDSTYIANLVNELY